MERSRDGGDAATVRSGIRRELDLLGPYGAAELGYQRPAKPGIGDQPDSSMGTGPGSGVVTDMVAPLLELAPEDGVDLGPNQDSATTMESVGTHDGFSNV